MKKNLTRLSLIMLMTFVSILVSCKKESLTEAPNLLKLDRKVMVTPETPNPGGGLGNFVVQNSNGDYVTAYGGGINFGNTFVYPLNVQSYQNGTPYSPFYYGGYSPANMLEFHQMGTSFVMLLGTVVGGYPVYSLSPLTLQGIQNYYIDLDKWFNGELQTMPHLAAKINQVGGNANGIITITGTFILDTASPTNVSVTNIVYTPTSVE